MKSETQLLFATVGSSQLTSEFYLVILLKISCLEMSCEISDRNVIIIPRLASNAYLLSLCGKI